MHERLADLRCAASWLRRPECSLLGWYVNVHQCPLLPYVRCVCIHMAILYVYAKHQRRYFSINFSISWLCFQFSGQHSGAQGFKQESSLLISRPSYEYSGQIIVQNIFCAFHIQGMHPVHTETKSYWCTDWPQTTPDDPKLLLNEMQRNSPPDLFKPQGPDLIIEFQKQMMEFWW